MDDLDRLLGGAMHDAAEGAPADDGVLRAVHRRSERIQRQRISIRLSAVAALLAVGLPTAVTLLARPSAPRPPAETAAPTGTASAWPSRTASTAPAPTPTAIRTT